MQNYQEGSAAAGPIPFEWAPVKYGRNSLMSEMSHAREDHRKSRLVRGGNDVLVVD